MLDERLGKVGGEDTKVCAVSLQPVGPGMIRYSLGDGFYFRVHPRYQRLVTPEHVHWLGTLIPHEPPKASKKKKQDQVEEDES